MFYSQSLLSKGALRNIWVAAYFFKKLKKEQIADTDISSAIDKILPDGQISYRVLAQLLLGIVKIFSKKVEFLHKDCHDTLMKVRKFSIAVLPRKTVNLSSPRVRKRAIHAPNKAAAIESEDASSLQAETAIAPPSLQVETAIAPSQDFGITVPKRFELDSFDLQIEEEMEHTEHNETPSKNTWTEDREKEHFLIERDRPETAMRYDSSAACFTPFDDVLPPDLLELDFVSDHANASSGVDPKGDRIQGYSSDIEKFPNHESLGARRSLDIDLSVDQEHSVEVQECLPSENRNLSPIVESIIHMEKEAIHDEIPDHEKYRAGKETLPEVRTAAQGPASPKFTVSTPSKREQPRQNKRKLPHWDKQIVLSNKLLKTWIHDANDLACKRRKVPITDLDIWRSRMFSKQCQTFSDPSIIYCLSPDLGALFNLDAFSPMVPSNSIESADQRSDLSDRPSDQICQPESAATIDVSSPPKADNGMPCEVLENEVAESFSAQITDQGLDQMSKEAGCFETGELHDEECSGRTRSVAHFLNKRLSCGKDQEQQIALSLDFILHGSKRSKCARFFYETLTLKTAGYIDVSQSCAYGDIVICGTPMLEELCKN